MRALLEDLNSLHGVVGSMICDPQAGVLARAFPPEFDDRALAAVASVVSAATPRLASLTGPIGVVDLRYRAARVVVRPAGDAALVVLCDKSASAQEVVALASVTCKKLSRLRSAGRVDGAAPLSTLAPASTPAPGATPAPVPSAAPADPAPAVPAKVTLAPPPAARVPSFGAPEPQRRTPLALVAALVVAALGAAAGVAWFTMRPRPGDERAEVPPLAQPPALAAAPAAPPPGEAPAAAPVEVQLRLSGADTLAAELAPALAAGFLAAQGAADVEVARATPGVVLVRGTARGAAVGIEIRPGDSADGLEALHAGGADVALAARRASAEERQKLAPLGDMTSAACEHVVGVDGIAVVVNRANPVPSIRREQLAQLLAGKLADWNRLGGAGERSPVPAGIHVYLPEDRSGIPEVVRAALLGGKPFGPEARRVPTPETVAEAVSADPGGLGLVPMAAVAGARAVPIAEGRGPPGLPTAFTVASESYPLTRRLYLYTARTSSNPAVARFVEFALSPEGQALVRRAGFVELGARIDPRQASAPAPVPADAGRRSASAVPAEPRAQPATGTGTSVAAATPAPASAPPPAPERPAEPPRAAAAAGDPGPTVVSPAPAPAAAPPAAPAPQQAAIEEAPVYATGNFRRPQMAEPGCVQRGVRIPDDVYERVVGKTITVRFAVNKDGAPSRFRVMTPGVPDRAGDAIWTAVQRCRWVPGADDAGEPAAIWVMMPFRFAPG